MTGRLRRVIVFALVTCGALIGCTPSKSLATTVDDLIRAGRYSAAMDEIRAGVPKLIDAQNVDELAELRSVINGHLTASGGSSVQTQVQEVAATSSRTFFKELINEAEELPMDDICEAIIGSATPPWPPGQTIDGWLRDSARLESAKDYCALLGFL